jgi:hypothetical protein
VRHGLILVSVAATCSLGLLAGTASSASVPAGATAECRDGSYSFSQHHSGTCSRHGGVAVFLTASSGSTGAAGSPGETETTSGACGVERWTVKTLQDRPTLRPVRRATVAFLVSRPAPSNLPDTRLPFEHDEFRVTAAVTVVRKEADNDLHLVLREGSDHMIAEAPLPACAPEATPSERRQMASVRSTVRLCAEAEVSGVAFFDFKHGQTGVAPNAIELHPILAFRCLRP